MGNLTFSIPHTVGAEDAKARMQKLIEHWAVKYGIQHSWDAAQASVSGKVMGINLKAKLDVSASAVSGEASDPGMLLRGQARKYLEEKVRFYLDPKRTVAELKGGGGD